MSTYAYSQENLMDQSWSSTFSPSEATIIHLMSQGFNVDSSLGVSSLQKKTLICNHFRAGWSPESPLRHCNHTRVTKPLASFSTSLHNMCWVARGLNGHCQKVEVAFGGLLACLHIPWERDRSPPLWLWTTEVENHGAGYRLSPEIEQAQWKRANANIFTPHGKNIHRSFISQSVEGSVHGLTHWILATPVATWKHLLGTHSLTSWACSDQLSTNDHRTLGISCAGRQWFLSQIPSQMSNLTNSIFFSPINCCLLWPACFTSVSPNWQAPSCGLRSR